MGQLAGIEDDINVSAADAAYTNPDQVAEFVKRTGVDSLVIAIGTSHSEFKFKPGQKSQLRFDILKEIENRIPRFPIVLHGASSVFQEYVREIQQYGGVRKVLVEDPSAFDPRTCLKEGRANIRALVSHKIIDVLGSDQNA